MDLRRKGKLNWKKNVLINQDLQKQSKTINHKKVFIAIKNCIKIRIGGKKVMSSTNLNIYWVISNNK